MKTLLSLVFVSILASGCMRTAAKTAPDAPLDMPAPPPREMEPSETETPAPVPLVTEPARNTPPRPRPVPREPPARVEPPKPEPPKVEPPIEVPKPVEEPPKSPSTLQTTPATAEGEVERAIRASLLRANADLNRIDYRVLNADAKTQYDTAKRFIRQADEALRAKNLVFAKTVADKAVVLAAQLGGR
jgi:outer membrane biosynthesis protein TonB